MVLLDCTYFSIPGSEEAIHFPLPNTPPFKDEGGDIKLETKLTFVRLENADIVHGSRYTQGLYRSNTNAERRKRAEATWCVYRPLFPFSVPELSYMRT